ncbi:MAG: hypothetical protein ACKV2Q_13530 [Planctomycetaceae bacterium]
MKRLSLKRLDRRIRPLHARGLNDASIAEKLGCRRRDVCTRRRAMGLAVNYESWCWRVTPVRGHDRMLRAMYAAGKFDLEIARAIGVGKRSVSLRRAELGLPTLDRCSPCRKLAGHDVTIRRLLKRGWSDSEIGAEIGSHQRDVGARRKFLGLPASGNNARRRAKVAIKTREQMRLMGLPSMAYLRIESFKKFARDRGWPEEVAPRAVQILEVLFERGLMTRRQIVVAIGMNVDRPQKNWLFDSKNQTSYLATLMRLGLVARSPRLVVPGTLPGKRKMVGRGIYFYGLSAEARTRKELWNDAQILSAGGQLVAAADDPQRNRATGKGRGGQDHRRRLGGDYRRLQSQGEGRA